MFKYIDMPKLVAFYLREFTARADEEPSVLYKFIFCLCLPFVSAGFRKARLIALAISECTQSIRQIERVFNKVTGGAEMFIVPFYDEYMVTYNGYGEFPEFAYSELSVAKIPYAPEVNTGKILITLNGVPKSVVEAYLPLLIPFYFKPTYIYTD